MIRALLNAALCILIIAITHPYAFFSFAFHPLQVTIYWDAPDQDEDIFVSRINADNGSSDMVYQEESKRDHDRKSKLKLKFKIVFPLNHEGYVSVSLFGTENGDALPTTPLQSFLADHFHPPNLAS